MANLTHRDPLRNGVTGLPRTSTSDDTPRNGLVGIDDELREEMSRLSAANSELMKSIRARHESTDEVSKLRPRTPTCVASSKSSNSWSLR